MKPLLSQKLTFKTKKRFEAHITPKSLAHVDLIVGISICKAS